MPVDERTTKGGERCDQHPTRSAVGTCDGCGRPLCLSCAIPVRGRLLGAECLPEPLAERPAPRRRLPLAGTNLLTGAAVGLALLATALPWTRFGVGSGIFGAWRTSPAWAFLAATSALAGAAVWVARQVLPGGDHRTFDVALAALGALVAVASVLAIWHPPAFSRVWIGPWVGLVAGICAAWASLVSLRRARPAQPVRV